MTIQGRISGGDGKDGPSPGRRGAHGKDAQGSMNSLDKMLSILDLFDDRSAVITPEDVERTTGASRSSAYRYLQSLADAGLIAQAASGSYTLGARILELDRLQRNSDQLLAAARPVMEAVSTQLGFNMILSRYHGNRVICSHTAWPDTTLTAIYERGRPLPLFFGAMAKVILANLGPYQLRNLMLKHVDEIRSAGLGGDWKEFRTVMGRLRRQKSCVTHAEITPESVGVAAPIFDADDRVIGSIAFAIPRAAFERLSEDGIREEAIAAAEMIMANLHRAAAEDDAAPAPRNH